MQLFNQPVSLEQIKSKLTLVDLDYPMIDTRSPRTMVRNSIYTSFRSKPDMVYISHRTRKVALTASFEQFRLNRFCPYAAEHYTRGFPVLDRSMFNYLNLYKNMESNLVNKIGHFFGTKRYFLPANRFDELSGLSNECYVGLVGSYLNEPLLDLISNPRLDIYGLNLENSVHEDIRVLSNSKRQYLELCKPSSLPYTQDSKSLIFPSSYRDLNYYMYHNSPRSYRIDDDSMRNGSSFHYNKCVTNLYYLPVPYCLDFILPELIAELQAHINPQLFGISLLYLPKASGDYLFNVKPSLEGFLDGIRSEYAAKPRNEILTAMGYPGTTMKGFPISSFSQFNRRRN